MSAYSFVGEMTNLNAKRFFLQILRSMCCEESIECEVILNIDFPITWYEEQPLLLKTTCFGLLFCVTEQSEDMHINDPVLLLNIDYSQIMNYGVEGDVLLISAVIEGRETEFKLERNAAAVKKVVDAHYSKEDQKKLAHYFGGEKLSSTQIAIEDACLESDDQDDMCLEAVSDISISEPGCSSESIVKPSPRSPLLQYQSSAILPSKTDSNENVFRSSSKPVLRKTLDCQLINHSRAERIHLEVGDVVGDRFDILMCNPGFVFRYRIESAARKGSRSMFVENFYSGDKLILKFMRQDQIADAVEIYQKVDHCRHVNK